MNRRLHTSMDDPPCGRAYQRRTLSTLSCMSDEVMQRRDSPGVVTDSTMQSVTATTTSLGGTNNGRPCKKNERKQKKKKSLRGRLAVILKRGKRPMSEAQLRKKLRRAAERGDWDTVRKLISGYEFSDVDDIAAESAAVSANGTSVRTYPPADYSARRPSYGSREQRRSFTGKESAAAAMRAAALEEGSPAVSLGSSSRQGERRPINADEKVLHDVCRHRPPLDVLETLLAALRRRRGCTHAADDAGQTPLRWAAASGSEPAVADALIRTDPSPASMGDDERRSPQHFAVRRLVDSPPASHHHENSPRDNSCTPDETPEETLRTVRIPKEAMLTYAGRIDFKDKDDAGFSSVEHNEELIQALIRRKETKHRNSSRRPLNNSFSRRQCNNLTCGRSFGSRHSVRSTTPSVTEDLQDIEILLQLERGETEVRTHRIERLQERICEEEHKARMSDTLSNVFGIQEQLAVPVGNGDDVAAEGAARPASIKPRSSAASPVPPPNVLEILEEDAKPPAMTEADIYNKHMQDYLNVQFDFEGIDLQFHDEDEFDIFEDPEELDKEPRERKMDEEIIEGLPFEEIMVVEEDDCMSLVSEVTAPLAQTQ